MDNWLFIVIIVVGIVSSLLNKKPKRVTEVPTAKPNDYNPAPAYHPKGDTNWNKRSEEIRRTSESNKNDTIYEQIKQEDETGQRKDKNLSKEVKKPLYQEKDLMLNPNRLVEGIVWSEVLGPPRSRKPHYSSYQRNKFN